MGLLGKMAIKTVVNFDWIIFGEYITHYQCLTVPDLVVSLVVMDIKIIRFLILDLVQMDTS